MQTAGFGKHTFVVGTAHVNIMRHRSTIFIDVSADSPDGSRVMLHDLEFPTYEKAPKAARKVRKILDLAKAFNDDAEAPINYGQDTEDYILHILQRKG